MNDLEIKAPKCGSCGCAMEDGGRRPHMLGIGFAGEVIERKAFIRIWRCPTCQATMFDPRDLAQQANTFTSNIFNEVANAAADEAIESMNRVHRRRLWIPITFSMAVVTACWLSRFLDFGSVPWLSVLALGFALLSIWFATSPIKKEVAWDEMKCVKGEKKIDYE